MSTEQDYPGREVLAPILEAFELSVGLNNETYYLKRACGEVIPHSGAKSPAESLVKMFERDAANAKKRYDELEARYSKLVSARAQYRRDAFRAAHLAALAAGEGPDNAMKAAQELRAVMHNHDADGSW